MLDLDLDPDRHLALRRKTETALAALEAGVRAVVILDGRLPNASLLELFTEHGAGSIIRSSEARHVGRRHTTRANN